MYQAISNDLGFDFTALVNAAAPAITTGVDTYGKINAIRRQPSTVMNYAQPAPAPVSAIQPAPVAAPQPKKSNMTKYLTIGVILAIGIGGGVMFARKRSRR